MENTIHRVTPIDLPWCDALSEWLLGQTMQLRRRGNAFGGQWRRSEVPRWNSKVDNPSFSCLQAVSCYWKNVIEIVMRSFAKNPVS